MRVFNKFIAASHIILEPAIDTQTDTPMSTPLFSPSNSYTHDGVNRIE